MTPSVEFAVSYRALSDSALISCADSEVAAALGVPVDGVDHDRVDQRRVDHDTTVETIGVDDGGSSARCFLAAQVLGVSARSRHGLVDHVLPLRLHSTLMTLVHEAAVSPSDVFVARRAVTRVPLDELYTMWSPPATTCRPTHEVKAVCAALDDVARLFARSRSPLVERRSLIDLGAALRTLLDELDEADGLPVPFAAARTARALSEAPAPLRCVTVPMAEAVVDLASGDPWGPAAGILRDARERLRRPRPGDELVV